MSPRAPRRAARRGYETEVIVCARREAGLEVSRDGRIVAAAPVAMPLTRRLDAAGLQLRPLAPASPVRRESIRRAPAAERALASLATCFLVTAAGGAPPPTPEQARELAADLSASDAVETAYVKPPVALPVEPGEAPAPQRADGRPAVTPSLRARQGYLDPAPRGIGAEAAWARPGGLGEGVRVIDIEMAWRFSHEDLRNRPNRLLSGRQPGQRDSRNHGTNVLGMLAADHNGRGIMGICPAADVRCISIGTDEWTSSAAVREAADVLGPGDIILVELERSPGTEDDPAGYLPIEWWPDDLDAIRYATGKGVIVVEAAGNSGLDLGTSEQRDATGFPAAWSDPFAGPDAPSGAVIVGAGAPPRAPARRRRRRAGGPRPLARRVLQPRRAGRRPGLGGRGDHDRRLRRRARRSRPLRRGRGPLVHGPLQRDVERRADGRRRAGVRAGDPAGGGRPPADPGGGARRRCARPAPRSSTARPAGSAAGPRWTSSSAGRPRRGPRDHPDRGGEA